MAYLGGYGYGAGGYGAGLSCAGLAQALQLSLFSLFCW